MQLKSLSLSQFRNISEASFHPDSALTVICGNNGQGKTNLLEAVWLFTGGKSFRGSKDVELIQKEQAFSILEGDFVQPEQWEDGSLHQEPQNTKQKSSTNELGAQEDSQAQENPVKWKENETAQHTNIRITIGRADGPRPGRQAKKNGVELGRATNLVGNFSAVVFAPNHLTLVKGSPDGRRRFIDGALCQLYPNFITVYRRYLRAIAQKNAALKQYQRGMKESELSQLLDVYDHELSIQGEEIQKRRLAYLETLSPLAIQNYQEISNNAETLGIRYQSQFAPEQFADKLAAARHRELAAGCCLIGPHREDFEITLNGEAAKVYASQGQQRSAVLSLKLAEASATQVVTGTHPVMLLDDVLSELDENRQSYLLQRMQGKQVMITSCDDTAFLKTNGKIVVMEQGVLTE